MSRFVFAAVVSCIASACAETAYFTAVRDLLWRPDLRKVRTCLLRSRRADSGLVIASATNVTPESVRAFCRRADAYHFRLGV